MSDYLPPGTTDHDADAPWNQEDDDGAAEAHGIEMVTGGDADSTLETFAEFVCGISDTAEKLIGGSEFWLRPSTSTADLIKILLSDNGTQAVVRAALTELRARYLAASYTKTVIERHADAWVLEKREAMAEGA